MAEPLSIVATGLGVIATAIGIWRAITATSPEVVALTARVATLEAARAAADARARELELTVLGDVRELQTLVRERTRSGGARDSE